MSDFTFSSQRQRKGLLGGFLASICPSGSSQISEFHGNWGSIAVSTSRYHGFKIYETDAFLIVVAGAPALYFSNNEFLVKPDSSDGSKRIFQRWVVDNNMRWDEDLSGPFALILINKPEKKVQVVTDLMSFIPVFYLESFNGRDYYLGTHIDALALSTKEKCQYDHVSMADFFLNHIVTFPFTMYEKIRQLQPACVSTLSQSHDERRTQPYWTPYETSEFSNIQDAADAIRRGVSDYIDRISADMQHIAQFVSSGEDSRAICGLLPKNLKRDGFIFLDNMNREGRIAERISKIYAVNLFFGFREKTHYLDILRAASRLVGSGNQYFHAHTLLFDEKFALRDYDAVFGGFLADSLLKAPYTRKSRYFGRVPFIPKRFISGETRSNPISHSFIKPEILSEVNQRRRNRAQFLKSIRPITTHEWFVVWPSSMRTAIGNFYSTRRLFRSYEPFMCNSVVKISASVPTEWKLNRRLFNLAFKPYLHDSKWIFHGDGRLPYFNWKINTCIQAVTWPYYRFIGRQIGLLRGNQGSWVDWSDFMRSEYWKTYVKEQTGFRKKPGFFEEKASLEEIFNSDRVGKMQKVNLLQLIASTYEHHA